MILPGCDWVITARKKGWFRMGFEFKVLAVAKFRAVLGSLIEPCVFNGPRVDIIRPESRQKVAKLLAACEADFEMSEFKRADAGSFIDIDPMAPAVPE